MKRITALTLALVLLLGILAGCASQAVTSETNTPSTDAPSATPADSASNTDADSSAEAPEKLDTVTVVFPRSLECLDDMAYYCAEQMGYFEQEGINLVMQEATNPDDVTLVASGQADFANPSANLILTSIEAGLPIKVASGYDAINIFGFSALNGSGIDSIDDLKGHTVALGDAAWATIAAPTLIAAGIDPDKDIEYVVCGDSRYQMVAEGKVDILFTWISEYDQLIGQGFDFNYIDGNEILQCFANSFVGNVDLMEERKDVYTRFFRALDKGMYFMYCNPEAAADIVCNTYPAIDISWEGAVGVAKGRIDQAFDLGGKLVSYYVDEVGIGYMTDEKWIALMEKDVEAGVISSVMDPSICYTNDIIPGPLSAEDKAQCESDAAAYVCTSAVYKSAN